MSEEIADIVVSLNAFVGLIGFGPLLGYIIDKTKLVAITVTDHCILFDVYWVVYVRCKQ